MRTIKFRGKRKEADEFVCGDLIHGVGSKSGKMFILPHTHIYPKGCNDLDGWNVRPETVGQLTGLTDKNGKEIYEGDILINSIGRHYIVEFYRGSHWLKCNETLYSCLLVRECSHLEIIGNIHDNPSLLTNK